MNTEGETTRQEETIQPFTGYRNPYSSMLIEAKNIIFHGAPGTGKTHLAREIAADIISNGCCDDYTLLTEEQKQQVGFVQFHPSYDYSDFVEGLRPIINKDGTMIFDCKNGIFKKFVSRARTNFEDSQKSDEQIELESLVQKSMDAFFEKIVFLESENDAHDDNNDSTSLETAKGKKFFFTSIDEKNINVFNKENPKKKNLSIKINNLKKMLMSDQEFLELKDVNNFFPHNDRHLHSYLLPIYNEIKKMERDTPKPVTKREPLKKYVFIIDEINRGEISKIFGELFFAIDPGYRGEAGAVSTQYSYLHNNGNVDNDNDNDDTSDDDTSNKKFYIPDNVYIIGTMNDIDRSVDSFDFAMRRRFRFVELKANDHLEMLASLEDDELKKEAIRRMLSLNQAIAAVEELNANYQIGAAYFLKLKTMSFDQLWTDQLEPLLHDYVHGLYEEKGIMERFAKAYGYRKPAEGSTDEHAQN